MERLMATILMLALPLVVEAQAPVILTAGQSNTDGRVTEELPEYIKENGYKHCHWCYGSYDKIQTDGFEPFWPRTAHVKHPKSWAYDAVFYHLLEQELQRDFYVVKWTLGGTAIDPGNPLSTNGLYWSPDKDWLAATSSTLTGGRSLLLSFIEEIDSCIDSHLSKLPEGYEIEAFLWHQGESDKQMAVRYKDNLRGVVNYVRQHLVEKTGDKRYARLPFICGTVARSNRDYSPEIESALWQLSEEMENFHIIDMADAELQRDRLHFTAKSAERLGRGMFEVYKNVCAKAQTQSEMWIPSGQQKVFGVLSKPENHNNERQPIVIIAHGFNGTHEHGRNYFGMFNRLGYQCFTLDFPCGSVNSKSDPNTLNMSVIDEQQALESVIRHFQQQPDIDPDRVVLLGSSQGGLIAALAAANPSNRIHRLILVFPALCIPDNWNDRYKEIADIPVETTLWNVKLGRRFFTELRYLRPYDIIGQFERPVQIIQGDADKIVPVAYARRAAETYKDARLHIIPGAGHGFKPAEFQEELRVIEEFLK